MYQAPEVEHLQRAVDAVKRAVQVKRSEPDQSEIDGEETEQEDNETMEPK